MPILAKALSVSKFQAKLRTQVSFLVSDRQKNKTIVSNMNDLYKTNNPNEMNHYPGLKN